MVRGTCLLLYSFAPTFGICMFVVVRAQLMVGHTCFLQLMPSCPQPPVLGVPSRTDPIVTAFLLQETQVYLIQAACIFLVYFFFQFVCQQLCNTCVSLFTLNRRYNHFLHSGRRNSRTISAVKVRGLGNRTEQQWARTS